MSGVLTEVWPHVVAAVFLGQFRQVIGQLLLAVPPGEVGIGLVEAHLGETPHHLRAGKGLRQENDPRVDLSDLGDQPLPEGQRLGMRVVDTKDPHALFEPEEHDIAQGVPEAWDGLAIEVDIDDVFVLLRRVLGVLDGAVGPPVEPLRMFLDPG